jgi:hypothetical protein
MYRRRFESEREREKERERKEEKRNTRVQGEWDSLHSNPIPQELLTRSSPIVECLQYLKMRNKKRK